MSEHGGFAKGFLCAVFAVVKAISDFRLLISGLCAMLLALSFPVEAQQPTKVRKIGFLNQTGAFSANVEAFRQGMRDLGLKAKISLLNSDLENAPN